VSDFDRAAELLDELLALPSDSREAALASWSAEPPSVLDLLRRMLAGADAPTPGLDTVELRGGDAFALPESIGPYRILGLLGEGGMGRVFEAQQADPERRVALKVIRGPFASEAQKQRFATEAQALAWLNHPGIATVYETGTATVRGEECPYLAMERVEGEALDAYIVNNAPSLSARVELLARISEAVHHAHQRGVVHRDLKPANVLVDADGRPKVLDFGIARLSETDGGSGHANTATGQVVGTVAYMSPEQFAGRHAEIDVRADVYALGVLLYESLSGRRPFELAGLPLHEAARVVVREDAPALGTLDHRLRGDLETIAAKALESERDRRYAGAAELAADLRRFLEHQPIEARPRTTAYKLRKFTRRNRRLVAGTASTLLALAIGLVGTVTLAVRAERRTEQALAAKDVALRSGREAQQAEERARAAEAQARAAEQDARKQAEIALAVRDLFLRVLDSARPSRSHGREVTVLEAVAAAEEQIDAVSLGDPEVEYSIQSLLGFVLSSLGDLQGAVEHTAAAVDLARERFGTRSEEYRNSLTTLAVVRDNAGDDDGVLEMFREVLAGCTLVDPEGERVPDLQDYIAYGKLGNAEHDAGHFQRAAEISERAVAGLRNYAAEAPLSLALELFRLSTHYMFLGDRSRELANAEEAFLLARDSGFENFIWPLLLYEQYANALDDIGRPEEAIDLYEEAIVKSTAWYGSASRETAGLEQNLAITLLRTGHVERARELLLPAYEQLRISFGPSSANALLVLRSILLTYAVSDRLDEGLMWLEPHLPEIPDVFNGWLVQLVRGQMMTGLGLHEQALEILQPTFEKVAQSLPRGNEHLLDALEALAVSCEALGRTADAERYRDLRRMHLAARNGVAPRDDADLYAGDE